MKITIITVCYNAANTIEDTIVSVESQNYKNIEYIVIDGASDDGTADILRRHTKNITHWVSEPDKGIYDAMNKGLFLATGDIVGFLNADDIYASEDVLSIIAQEMTDNNIEACYSDLMYVKKNDASTTVRYWKSCDFDEKLYKTGWCPPHLTFFARKSVYNHLGNFDTRFKLAADFDLLLRFLQVNRINTKYLPFVSVKMRMGGATNNSIKNIIKQNIEILQSYKKYDLKISIPYFLIQKSCARVGQFLHDKFD